MPIEVLRLKVSKECFEQIDSGILTSILIGAYDKENVPKLLDVVGFSQAYDFSVQTFRKGFIEKFLRKYDYAIISCDGNDDEIRLNDPKIVIHGNDNGFCYAVEFSDKVLVAQEFYQRSIIRCATCMNEMDVYRGQFPICDDCLKVLREIIKERRLEKENK